MIRRVILVPTLDLPADVSAHNLFNSLNAFKAHAQTLFQRTTGQNDSDRLQRADEANRYAARIDEALNEGNAELAVTYLARELDLLVTNKKPAATSAEWAAAAQQATEYDIALPTLAKIARHNQLKNLSWLFETASRPDHAPKP
jgi:hypothetical protein